MTLNARLIALLVSALLAATPVAAQPSGGSVPSVTVSGEASTSLPPDLAIVRGGVTSDGKTAREASAANAKTMSAVLAAVKAAGIAEKDLQTSSFSIQPVRDREGQRVTGFQASNRVTVQIRDLAKVSDVLDRMTEAGANTISGIEFAIASPSKTMDEVRGEAVADARRKAEIYARAAGASLGRAISISEEGAPSRPIVMRAAPKAAFATPVATGEEELRVSVTVSFELIR